MLGNLPLHLVKFWLGRLARELAFLVLYNKGMMYERLKSDRCTLNSRHDVPFSTLSSAYRGGVGTPWTTYGPHA